ncbi:MAG: elongation factor G [Clostridiales bacterium 43-6]|nr:MAG: elongation factor G [Clostridiales bacterium 43-6]
MKQYGAKNIKNVALVGHGGSGKTSLAEAMLFLAGASDRLGKVTDSNTVMDFDPEEKKRKASVSTAVAPLEWKEHKINIIDAPGLFDFASGVNEALRAAETALIVLSGKSGLNVGAEKAYKAASARGIAKMFFIGKLDSENADYFKTVASLTEKYGTAICPVIVPYVVDRVVKCYVNLATEKAYEYKNGKAAEVALPDLGSRYEEMHNLLCESVASVDEELMEKFFGGEAFTAEEILKGLSEGVASGDIAPVYCGAGLSTDAVDLLLDGIVKIAPAAAEGAGETAKDATGKEVKLTAEDNGPLAAIVFKTIADPFVGKLSYFKVASGKLSADSHVINARTGENERINKVMIIKAGKQEETPYIGAGDIGAVAKLGDVATGDTLTDPSKPLTLEGISFPDPSLSMAMYPKAKGDEEKIASGLARLMEEDPSISYVQNVETHELVVSGLGEQHLDVVVSKLKSKFGVEVILSIPKVAYRETIRKSVKVQGRHKKQSGGHGQFGDVWIEFSPCDSDSLVFETKVVGGAVPKGFFPAVEKGLHECIHKGVLAGYPVVGLNAVLYDGSYHPVDSSEMSFKLAAAVAYKTGLPQASPTLLEPIGTLKALVPDEMMGDIMGDVNKRRGRVLGMNPMEDRYQEVVAEVPMAEMGDFSITLRSLTQGRGSFSFKFERYDDAPPAVAQKVIDEAKRSEESA